MLASSSSPLVSNSSDVLETPSSIPSTLILVKANILKQTVYLLTIPTRFSSLKNRLRTLRSITLALKESNTFIITPSTTSDSSLYQSEALERIPSTPLTTLPIRTRAKERKFLEVDNSKPLYYLLSKISDNINRTYKSSLSTLRLLLLARTLNEPSNRRAN